MFPIMEPACTNIPGRMPVSRASVIAPHSVTVSIEDKEDCFRELEERFIAERSETNYVSMMYLLLYSGEGSRLEKAITDYTTKEFSVISCLFSAILFFKNQKIVEAAIALKLYLGKYPNSPEGIFLAAELSNMGKAYSSPIPAVRALAAFLRRDLKEAANYLKENKDKDLEWLAILIYVAKLEGYDETINKSLAKLILPRCALILLLSLGFKNEHLERMFERNLSVFPYDYELRAAVMKYYLMIGEEKRALEHYDLYVLSEPQFSDNLIVRAEFQIDRRQPRLAWGLADQYKPTSQRGYEKLVTIYKRIKGAEESLEACLKVGIKRFPKSLYLSMEYAHLLDESGRFEESAAAYNKVLEIDPHQREALMQKAVRARSFKVAKPTITILENRFPSDPVVLYVTTVLRDKYNEELSRALAGAKELWVRDDNLENTKLLLDLLLKLEKYKELLDLSEKHYERFPLLYTIRVAIALLRIGKVSDALTVYTTYEEKMPEVSRDEIYIKGEIFAELGRYEEAYPLFKGLTPASVHVPTMRSCFKCLKALDKSEEARAFYSRIEPGLLGFFGGEYSEWFLNARKTSTQSVKKSAPKPALSSFIDVKKKEEPVEKLVRPSSRSISLIRDGFSKAATEGVDPLAHRTVADVMSHILTRATAYPTHFIPHLDEAVSHLASLRSAPLNEAPYYLIRFLEALHRHPDAVPVITSRVIDFESLRASFKLLKAYPHLITADSLKPFTQEILKLVDPLRRSKSGIHAIDPLVHSPITDPTSFEALPAAQKVAELTNFIQTELESIYENQAVNFNDKDSSAIRLMLYSGWRIRSALGALRRYDIDAAERLRLLFPEFAFPKNPTYLSLDGIDFEMMMHVYLNAHHKLEKV